MRFLIVVMAVLLLAQCNETPAPEKQAEKVINPNGDSELALLMRQMFDDVVNEPVPDEFLDILRRADSGAGKED